MEIDLAIEVSEVSFDEFERRKSPRENHINYSEDKRNAQEHGIEVNEISIEEFERKTHY